MGMIEIHCNKGCMVKEICRKNLDLNIETLLRNTDIGVEGCLIEKLIKNLAWGNKEKK
ncbi:MAG: hypothetical protein QIT40_gp18 [Lokiarchaeia virus VerdaV4]|uniref:Uncharacterized protein n=1 Tax=Lokiarchaeia virus VerdaV4 TaxID=3070172 RepID=A0AA35CNI5_9CAUD|nr:MAG: hypothetical protein QIT40_gp18 [Lokiarchaeia virus VerdaV4]BDI54976.1 MAG: hypothetical protein [Lokiarchaeia virus VerdaV4]